MQWGTTPAPVVYVNELGDDGVNLKVRFYHTDSARILALVVSFVAVPLLVWGVQAVMDLDEDIYPDLVLMAAAAGAPLLPRPAQTANGRQRSPSPSD